MKRSPLVRRTQLRRDGPGARRFAASRSTLERTAPPKRTAMKAARKPEDPALTKAKAAVRKRSGGFCEASTPACPPGCHEAHHAHHVVRRPHTGGAHEPADMLDVCWRAHDHIHAHPAESYDRGWLVRGTGTR